MARTPRTVRVALSGEQNTAGGRPIPWLLAAIGGAITVAVAGWAVLVGLSIAGWLGSAVFGFGEPLRLGTGFWLLANGGAAQIDHTQFTIVPLGVSGVIIFMIQGVAGYAAQQAREAKQLNRQVIWRLVGSFTITYLACVMLAAFATNQTNNMVRMIVVSLAMAAFPSLSICWKIADIDLKDSWPGWARSVPSAARAAVLTVLVGSGLALATALILSYDRVIGLHDSLNPGFIGSLLLVIVQLAYLPNFLAWCASWVLGAGFSIGQGSVISPSLTDIGLLPGVPVFAAVPDPGPGSWSMLWWLATGAAAGGIAAIMVIRARPKARFDETAMVGGLSGLVAGLLVVGVCAISNGSMGSGRLDLVGARMAELVIIAPSLLGISGLLVGVVLGLVWHREVRSEKPGSGSEEPISTDSPRSQVRSGKTRTESSTRRKHPGEGRASTNPRKAEKTATTGDGWPTGDEPPTAGSGERTRASAAGGSSGAVEKRTSSNWFARFLTRSKPATVPKEVPEVEEQASPGTSDDQGAEPTARVRAQE